MPGLSFGMPKSLSIRPAFCAALCGFTLCFAACLTAQSASNASPIADPKSLLLAAAAANGAPGADAKPWHAKISFTLNDWNGKPESQGTFEEFWAAPDKVKLVYATSSFNQVEYTTPSGIRRSGTRDGVPPEFTRIINQFLHPVPFDSASANTLKLEAREVSLGTTKLTCVAAASEKQDESAINETYCMNNSAPILRLILGPGRSQRTLRNSILKFQDRYFPQDVERDLVDPGEKNGRTQFTAKLEKMELMAASDDAQFTPPADATAPPQVITLDEKTTRPQLVQHAPPVYPPIAKAARVFGDVVISLQVQTDGRVARLRVLSGPAMLQWAALEGVKKWSYKPFAQNGETVEVNTIVTVPFRLIP